MPQVELVSQAVTPLSSRTGHGETSPHSGARPWPGFALAADAAVRDLHTRFDWDLWTVDRADGNRLVRVAGSGPWAVGEPRRVDERRGEFVRVPLLSSDGEPIGWLCGLSARMQPRDVDAARSAAVLLAGMLATIAAGERAAADRSAEAAAAYALATRDGLTGLLNRRGWEDALAAEQQRSRRYGRSASALMIDLDGLKGINDRHGHLAGDRALTTCAELLARECRPGDAVARLGGDEFAVLAVECDVQAARALTMRLGEALSSAGVCASVGSATWRPDEDFATTVQRADREMYGMKRRHTMRRRRISGRSPSDVGPALRLLARRDRA